MTHRCLTAATVVAAVLGGIAPAPAEQATQEELEALRRIVEEQAAAIRTLTKRVNELERGNKAGTEPGTTIPPASTSTPRAVTAPGVAPSPAEEAEANLAVPRGRQSPVEDRHGFDDRQEAVARPGDFTLDPQYRGFIPIPNTVMMLKFNPKPRIDMMFDTKNPGFPYRFVPASLPTQGAAGFGGGEQFNATANGSQLRLDLRAPSLPGNFRLYYQNDFFGSDTSQMRYRLQHLYGQYYGVVAGFTYGVFEDPDSWPDTVDYEGPNALIFARRPLVHYTASLSDEWNMTFGLEDPTLYIDTTGDPGGTLHQRAPDVGFNVRWERARTGHVQFSAIGRSLNVSGGPFGNENTAGWGINLGGSLDMTPTNTLQALAVYGHGVGGMGNDTSFVNSDAAFDTHGNLVALPYLSGLLAFTHHWSPRWRSTATFGYVTLDNTGLQLPTAYNTTRYGSVNVIYQLFKRLSIGVEGLYGFQEVKNGATSEDVFRANLGMVYSPFD